MKDHNAPPGERDSQQQRPDDLFGAVFNSLWGQSPTTVTNQSSTASSARSEGPERHATDEMLRRHKARTDDARARHKVRTDDARARHKARTDDARARHKARTDDVIGRVARGFMEDMAANAGFGKPPPPTPPPSAPKGATRSRRPEAKRQEKTPKEVVDTIANAVAKEDGPHRELVATLLGYDPEDVMRVLRTIKNRRGEDPDTTDREIYRAYAEKVNGLTAEPADEVSARIMLTLLGNNPSGKLPDCLDSLGRGASSDTPR